MRTLLVSAVLLTPATGCTTLAKQGLQEVLGAQAKVILVNEVNPETLRNYRDVRFEPATTTLSPRVCPPEVLEYADAAYAELREDLRDLYGGGEPALRVTTDLLYFQKKGLLGAAELLARVRMFDSDRLVVDALVRTVSKSFRKGGAKALARESVEAVGRFLSQARKEQRDEEDDEPEVDTSEEAAELQPADASAGQ